MKLIIYLVILAVLILAESPRLAVPLKDFFQDETELLSVIILAVSVSISIIGGKAINIISGFLIFFLVLSGWFTDLKGKYDTIIREAEESAQSQKLPIRKLKEKSGCWHKKDDKEFYNNCMSAYIQERNQTIEQNKLASAHNAKIINAPDLIEFRKKCGIAVAVSLFFSLAIWYYSKLAGAELPHAQKWLNDFIENRRLKKTVDQIEKKESDSLTEKIKSLDTVKAVDLILEKKLAVNDYQAVLFLSKIKPVSIEAEYRKVRRARGNVKNLSKTYSGLKVVNGGKE